jgi:hypothetical protein
LFDRRGGPFGFIDTNLKDKERWSLDGFADETLGVPHRLIVLAEINGETFELELQPTPQAGWARYEIDWTLLGAAGAVDSLVLLVEDGTLVLGQLRRNRL